MHSVPIVLASSSRYRKALLEKLQLPFVQAAPDVDESRLGGESAHALVTRLCVLKARAVAPKFLGAVIIGSDQVAEFEDTILTKPGTHERAVAQLTQLSGQAVQFFTGLSVLDTRDGSLQVECVEDQVKFRILSAAEIHAYVTRDQPLDAAGSFKAEGLGIALFESLHCNDPNSLVGLPLIRLVALLSRQGINVLTDV